MYKYLSFIALATIVSISACRPETESPVEPPVDVPLIELGKLMMKENEAVWTTQDLDAIMDGYGQITIMAKKLVHSNGTFQHLFINGIQAKTGKYALEKMQTSLVDNGVPDARVFWVLDGDQFLWEIGSTSDTPDDFVEIVKFDSINRIVEGRFSITVSNYRNLTVQWGLPELLELREGVFHVKLQN